jgi:sterol desaturase/sphingolipid hydroxylase (fatty acid hydroxylase superfamily)
MATLMWLPRNINGSKLPHVLEQIMSAFILENETTIRLGIFAGVLLGVALWEVLAPRRKLSLPRLARWPGNLGLVALNTLVLRFAFPFAAVATAWVAVENGWGLFNVYGLPGWLAVGLAVLLLDLTIYIQHVMVHAIPLFWRLHRLHHADLDYDVTTGARFHPLEIILSMAIKIGAIILLGAPALAVLIFEVLLNATAMFNHGNIRLPRRLDRVLRWIVVTPDMHRVHHSVHPRETNSNFGFNLPWWDRLFGTYRAQPEAGHDGMTLGIEQFRDRKYARLGWLLIQPLLGRVGNYPINASRIRAKSNRERNA